MATTKVSAEELTSGVAQLTGRQDPNEAIAGLIGTLDADGDGALNAAELQAALPKPSMAERMFALLMEQVSATPSQNIYATT